MGKQVVIPYQFRSVSIKEQAARQERLQAASRNPLSIQVCFNTKRRRGGMEDRPRS